MANSRSFGRRGDPRPPPLKPTRAAGAPPKASPDFAAATLQAPPRPEAQIASVDDEVRAWKKARAQGVQIPWRQLSLMAGLCFGIGSLVLPDTVNDMVQYLLYGLTAASFYAGLRKRRAT